MLWFKLERVGMTARGPQAEVHTAQTFAICVAATARNSWGNSIGRKGDADKGIWKEAAEPFW